MTRNIDSQQMPSFQSNELTEERTMSDKERANILAALAKSAYERFDKLSDVAWKLRLSVWTAFGGATGFVLASDKWRPNWIVTALGIALTASIIIIYVFFWSPFNYKRTTRFVRVANYWESEVQKLIGSQLPEYLRQKNWLGTGAWSSGD